jgi:hypothetical protein
MANNQEIEIEKNVFTIDCDAPITKLNSFLEMAYLNNLDTISGSAEDVNGAGVNLVELRIIRNSDNMQWEGSLWSQKITWLSATGTNKWSYDSRNIDWSKDAYYTVIARATDKIGNTGSEDEVTFMMDNTSPIELSITINNGDTYTKDTEVILTLSAKDTGSGVEKMAFSSNGKNWGVWEDYTVIKQYIISSQDGPKTIYFRVEDKAGNLGEQASATIILDTSEPVPDSDNDGINDHLDAFPEDPAASVDSDSDGYPDEWNIGKSQVHSTSNLTLDEYPTDPLKHSMEIEDKGAKETKYETIWFLIIPLIAVLLMVVFLLLMRNYRNNGKNE